MQLNEQVSLRLRKQVRFLKLTLGVEEVFSKSLIGLTPKKTKVGERVYKGEILTTGALDIMEYKNIV